MKRLLLLVGIAAIPAMVAQLYVAYALWQDREQVVHIIARGWAELAAGELEQVIEGTRSMLAALAAAPSVRSGDAMSCARFLGTLLGDNPQFVAVAAVRPDGRLFCASDEFDPGLSLADRPFFRLAMAQDAFVIGSGFAGRLTGDALLPLALRFRNLTGEPGGVVVAPLRLAAIAERFASRPVPPGTSIRVIHRNGREVLRLPADDTLPPPGGAPLPPERAWLAAVVGSGTFEAVETDDDKRVVRISGYVPLSETARDLVMEVAVPRDVIVAQLPRLAIGGAMVSAAGLLLALLVAWYGFRAYIERPVGALATAARRWAGGDLGARARTNGQRTELTQLAGAFNTMAATVQGRDAEREQLITQLRILVEELNHRARNSQASVRSILHQTARSAGSLDDFVPAFEARLAAFSRAHDLLSESDWQTTRLDTLTEAVVAPFVGRDPRRFRMRCGMIELSPQTALAMAMVLGELTTNAAKYGAFSTERGRVRLDCVLRADPADPAVQNLIVTWVERDGPEVTPPTRAGTGTRLMAQLARTMGGTIDLQYPPSGFEFRLSFPIAG